MMKITDHPGNFGACRGSLLTIHHADWPAYPDGDNCYEPLFQFTAFPPGTGFLVVDDIDRSLLFIADVKCGRPKEPFDTKNFHLAVWHEDLAELQRLGFIDGITSVTERQWNKLRWEKLRALAPDGLCRRTEDGKFIPIEVPNFDESDEAEECNPFVAAESGRICVTKIGRKFIRSTLKAQSLEIGSTISERVERLFEMHFFDTCIREACVQLEHEIKTRIASDAWGDQLTEKFVEHLRGKNAFLESSIRTFRQEMRSVFKMIRNDYMHNLSEADETTALVVLTRIARVRSMLRDKPNNGANKAPEPTPTSVTPPANGSRIE